MSDTPETDAAMGCASIHPCGDRFIDDEGRCLKCAVDVLTRQVSGYRSVTELAADYPNLNEYLTQEERRLTAMTRERDEWHLAAVKGACYRADSPHATPEEWIKSQTDAALALIAERDKARAMVSVAREALFAISCEHRSMQATPASSKASNALARLDEMEKEDAK